MNAIDWQALWKLVADQFSLRLESIHGPAHWSRVERNALLLAGRTGADPTVVRLFAVFHDSRRENEGSDPKHGKRGAKLAELFRGQHFDLDGEAFEKLLHACTWHTHQNQHDDPTIGTCYDADRLDLGRVGIVPSPGYMSTEFGREIARFGSIQPFVAKAAQNA